MDATEYQNKAMVTRNNDATDFLLSHTDENNIDLGGALNAALGLSGEVGEFNDMIKKWLFHGKELDIEHLKKELGDVCWYIALACDSFNWDLSEIMQMNNDKLAARYHGGHFNVYDAMHHEKGDV